MAKSKRIKNIGPIKIKYDKKDKSSNAKTAYPVIDNYTTNKKLNDSSGDTADNSSSDSSEGSGST